MTTKSQNAMILKHLKSGKKINPIQALAKYGCFRLGARIWDIKQMGYEVHDRMVTTSSGKKYKEYWL